MGRKEHVNCIICQRDDTSDLYKKDSFNIVKCKKCDLVYVNPRLKFDILLQMYNNNDISPFDYYFENRNIDEKTFDRRLKEIEKFKSPGTLLDVGCGIGVNLKQATKRGWEAYGIDIKKDSVKFAKNHFGVKAYCGSLDDHNFQNNFFDLIVMNDFIEHVPDPIKTFKIANNLLKDDGLIFLTTPNIDSFMAKIFRSYWLHLKPKEHIYYFSKSTIEEVLERAQCRIIHTKTFGRVRSLDTILSKMQTYFSFPYRLVSKLKLNKFLGKIFFYINAGDEIGVFAKKIK